MEQQAMQIQQIETFIRLSQRKLIIDKIGDKCLLRGVLCRNALIVSVKEKKNWIVAMLRKEKEDAENERLRQQQQQEEEEEEETRRMQLGDDDDVSGNKENEENEENEVNNADEDNSCDISIYSSSSNSNADSAPVSMAVDSPADEKEEEEEEEEVLLAGQVLPNASATTTTTSPLGVRSSSSPCQLQRVASLPVYPAMSPSFCEVSSGVSVGRKRCHSEGANLDSSDVPLWKKARTIVMDPLTC